MRSIERLSFQDILDIISLIPSPFYRFKVLYRITEESLVVYCIFKIGYNFLFRTAQLVRLIGSGVLAAGATIGIGIFYAGRDDKIRSEIEDKIPGSQTVLTAIYGDRKETNKDDEESSLLPLNKKLQELSTSLKQV